MAELIAGRAGRNVEHFPTSFAPRGQHVPFWVRENDGNRLRTQTSACSGAFQAGGFAAWFVQGPHRFGQAAVITRNPNECRTYATRRPARELRFYPAPSRYQRAVATGFRADARCGTSAGNIDGRVGSLRPISEGFPDQVRLKT